MLRYITRGNSSPQGKQRVYISGTNEDVERYSAGIAEMLFRHSNCTVYYSSPADEFDADVLQNVKLVVLIVTRRFLYSENAGYSKVFGWAAENHTAVLPIIMEKLGQDDLERLNGLLGDLQCLDPGSDDPTELGFDEKLERFLNSALIGDRISDEVRKAFDAYIFLSYRKKDRQYANELMKMIHSNEFARDVAIWFDEYLVPGENFNDSIRDALEKSSLFTLVVTPNLVNEENYVHSVEYPEAVKKSKRILPVEMQETDIARLGEQYGGIPECVRQGDESGLSQALLNLLEDIAKKETDKDPTHNFFIGLAYLAGIDVEKDTQRAIKLISSAAEQGLPQAMKKLSDMYFIGDGVARDTKKAAVWQERYKELMNEKYSRDKCYETAIDRLEAISELAEMHRINYSLEQMLRAYDELRYASAAILGEIPKRFVLARYQVEALHGIAYYYGQTDDIDDELEFERQAFEYSEYCLDHVRSESARKLAEKDYAVSAKRLSGVYLRKYDYENASKYAKLAFRFAEDISPDASFQDRLNFAESLREAGTSSLFSHEFAEAEKKLKRSLGISRELYAEFGDNYSLKASALCGIELGRYYVVMEQYEQADGLYRESAAACEKLLGQECDAELLRIAAEAYGKNLFTSLELGRLGYAEGLEDRYLEIASYSAKFAPNVDTNKDLARCYEGIARLNIERGNIRGAENLLRMGRNIYVQNFNSSKSFYSALDLAESDKKLWELFLKAGDPEQALKYCVECISVLYDRDGGEVEYGGSLLCDAYIIAGRIFRSLERYTECINLYKEGVDHFCDIFERRQSGEYGMHTVLLADELAELYLCLGNIGEAAERFSFVYLAAQKLSHLPQGRHYMAKALYSLSLITEGKESSDYAVSAFVIWSDLVKEFPENELYASCLKKLMGK